jgi:hypothetical protein
MAAAQATPGKRASEKPPADGELSRELPVQPPALKKFKADPVEGARSLLLLRQREAIEGVLADAEFVTALGGLAAKATKSPKAAVVLSRFALRVEFSSAAVAAIGSAAGAWPEPSSFEARDRRRAADALERARPSWASLWLAKALLSALPSPDLRRFLACRLLLTAGGLAGAVDALAKSLAAVESGRKKAGRDHLTLVRELRSCATPAAAPSAAASAFVEFIRAVTAGRPVADIAPVKLELAQLLLGAAAVDRGLVLDDKVLEIATTLDHDVAAELRTKAAELLPRKQTLPTRPTSTAPNQADLMREAASTEADQALGRALQDMGALARQFEQLEAAVEGQAADRARRAKGASELVLQWVRQAARHRSIEALGKWGERVPFDPEVHQVEDEASPGDSVRVVKPPIVRASGSQRIVVVRGEVELD